MRTLLLAMFAAVSAAAASDVTLDFKKQISGAPPVTSAHSYDAHVTLMIENADGTTTPSGWSTRKENGGDGRPFAFTPGKNLIEGWSRGVLKMKEGERALIHVPAALGYGSKAQGSKGGAWYIPASSNLLFDIEILGITGRKHAASEL